MTQTNNFKQWTQQSNSNTQKFVCVIIDSADSNQIRLVKGAPLGKTFTVDGAPLLFQGSAFEAPEVSVLMSDDTNKGQLTFNRVGYGVRQVEKAIGGLTKVTVRILVFFDENTTPEQDYTVGAGGINYTEQTVSVALKATNLSKVTSGDQIYTRDEFPGLNND